MRAPDFWNNVRGGEPPDSRATLLPRLLMPLAALYTLGGRVRRNLTRPRSISRPVLCVGNLTAGGTGKTPVALTLAKRLADYTPHFLTRGYGGTTAGPTRVDPDRHGWRDVGDEALLLARAAPCWVARDRFSGAQMADREGAGLIIMDDGHQNPGLKKTLSLIVIDGPQGFGNGHVIPAGPLREPVAVGLRRADAVVIIGESAPGLDKQIADNLPPGRPVFRATARPEITAQAIDGKRLVAFAGIGRPEKFFTTLRDLGGNIVFEKPFPDHHPFTRQELDNLADAAETMQATLVTTAKDAVRLPPAVRGKTIIVDIAIEFEDEKLIDQWLAPLRVTPLQSTRVS